MTLVLLMSLENKVRCVDLPCHFYINELTLRDKIYCTNGMHLNVYPIIQTLEAVKCELTCANKLVIVV